MDIQTILKEETDKITLQIDSYRKGYLDALAAIAFRLQTLEKPVEK